MMTHMVLPDSNDKAELLGVSVVIDKDYYHLSNTPARSRSALDGNK
jgi:hypothetical protein